MNPEPIPASDLRARHLAACDRPCARCGYNLRGLTGDRCPECGAPLRLGVHPASGGSAPMITGLTAACLGLGAHVPLWAMALPRLPLYVWINFATVPVYGAAIWWWWRRCRRGPRSGPCWLPWLLAMLTCAAAAGTGGYMWWSLFEALEALAY